MKNLADNAAFWNALAKIPLEDLLLLQDALSAFISGLLAARKIKANEKRDEDLKRWST